MWAAYLDCAELGFMLWHFKLDDSLLLRENVEGCHGMLYLYPDCLLPARCSSWGMDLSMHVSDDFINGLVVFSAAERIRPL